METHSLGLLDWTAAIRPSAPFAGNARGVSEDCPQGDGDAKPLGKPEGKHSHASRHHHPYATARPAPQQMTRFSFSTAALEIALCCFYLSVTVSFFYLGI